MKQDNMPQVARFWNDIASEFDSIYTGENKSAISRTMDHIFRKDMYQRYEWVMRKSGDVTGQRICDVGCGSGRFVTALAKKGAAHVTGVDVAPSMLKIARSVVEQDGVADRCDFALSDVLNWKAEGKYDLSIAIGFWDYIMEPPERLRLIRNFTTGKFLSAWPRYWTWRMPVRKVRLQYIRGCPVYFFRKPQVYKMIEEAGFKVDTCETIGKLFCVEATPV
jgi:SAM-dependent methyltransferase